MHTVLLFVTGITSLKAECPYGFTDTLHLPVLCDPNTNTLDACPEGYNCMPSETDFTKVEDLILPPTPSSRKINNQTTYAVKRIEGIDLDIPSLLSINQIIKI
uniref:Secreted protein n=1 Tax=Heterorhabditis bacteriophora TaxID=37862 RepID=A0A1I7X6D5_HETBA